MGMRPMRIKHAVCNELFGEMDFERCCELLATTGFDGIEIAPFTLFDESGGFRQRAAEEAATALKQSALAFAGLHWLLAAPEGLHITAADSTTRIHAADHLKYLLDFAGTLGGGRLILGSPNQRNSRGIPAAEAAGFLGEVLSSVADHAQACRSRILIESLASADTDVINTMEEAARLVELIDHPAIGGMFDFHNCGDEVQSWSELIRRHAALIDHIHLNTIDGGYPTINEAGEYWEAFHAIEEIGYSGWVSLEVFSIYPEPEFLLRQTLEFLRAIESPDSK